MSLANDILYGNAVTVAESLERGEDPNEIDMYGFTPLIEAAIVKKSDIANILLQAGADPNQTDMAGRTPLHWAAENNNPELARLLLLYKADPNAHTYTGQPVLTVPLLRNYSEIKTLLRQHQADSAFARDYIQAKLLGHRFELMGHAYIMSPKNQFVLVDMEGFYLEFSIAVILDSLKRFKNNYLAKQLRPYFDKLVIIIEAIERAYELIHYQRYTVNINEHQDTISKLLSHPLLLVPATYQGHAISFVRFGRFFAKIDRGANSQFEGSVIIYQITRPENVTLELFKHILYTKETDEFMHSGINRYLGLKRLLNLPIGPQITGNCSWANIEGAIPTMLFLLLLHDKDYANNIPDMIKLTLDIHQNWREWDKDRALDQWIASFNEGDKKRNAAKAIILAAVLFQSCQYTTNKNLERAEKIIKILREKDYQPYLENYVKVYYQDRWTDAGENLMHLFDMISTR